jgi:hypothetical protein
MANHVCGMPPFGMIGSAGYDWSGRGMDLGIFDVFDGRMCAQLPWAGDQFLAAVSPCRQYWGPAAAAALSVSGSAETGVCRGLSSTAGRQQQLLFCCVTWPVETCNVVASVALGSLMVFQVVILCHTHSHTSSLLFPPLPLLLTCV